MGAMPDWYPVVRAARYLGVAPWDLLERSSLWRDWALVAESVEAEVQDEIAKREAGT